MRGYGYGERDFHRFQETVMVGLQRLEKAMNAKLEPIRARLTDNEEYEFLVKHGLEGFKQRIEKALSKNFNPLAWVAEVVQKDTSLRFPHRKILEFLARQYDYKEKKFREVNYGRIVKECRLGRNRAKGYLEDLKIKGLMCERVDGYRVWYRLFFHSS